MKVDWRIAEDGPPRVPAAGAAPTGPDAGRPAAPRRRRPWLALAVGAVGLVALGARLVERHRLLGRVARDVGAVVMAEDAARARGDAEVARLHQTRRLRLGLRAAPDAREAVEGLPGPLPGLAVREAGAIEGVEVAPPEGGRVVGALAHVRYEATDGARAAAFRATRALVLEPDGRWRHDADPAPPLGRTTRLTAGNLVAIAGAEDARWIAPALRRAAAARAAYCGVARCGEGPRTTGGAPPPLTLVVAGAVPGRAAWIADPAGGPAGPALELPAPSRTLAPVDDAGEALLGEALVRIVLALSDADLRGRIERGPALLSGADLALRIGLGEAWLETTGALEGAHEGGEGAADPLDAAIWRIWPEARGQAPSTAPEALPPTSVRVAARAFGARVVAAAGAEALAELVRTLPEALPEEDGRRGNDWPSSLMAWLEGALGEAAPRLAAEGALPQAPAPDGVHFVTTCFGVPGFGDRFTRTLQVGPGAALRAIDRALCPRGEPIARAVEPAGRRVAALCAGTGESSIDPQLAIVDLSADAAPAIRAPLGGRGRWPIGAPRWSPDGRWVTAMTLARDEALGASVLDTWLLDATAPRGAAEAAPRRIARLVDPNATYGNVGAHVLAAWQPSGARLALVATAADGATVAIYDADAGRALWSAPGAGPVWSPDGSRLAYFGPPPAATGGAATWIVVDADGVERARRVVAGAPGADDPLATTGPERPAAQPASWSADGRWLGGAFRVDRHGRYALTAWRPSDDRFHLLGHLDPDGGREATWEAWWHPRAPWLVLARGDIFRDTAALPPWIDTPPRDALLLDVTTGGSMPLAPADRRLEPLHWPASPDGRWRTRLDAEGLLVVEPAEGGGEAWRLDLPGCRVFVDWAGDAAGG